MWMTQYWILIQPYHALLPNWKSELNYRMYRNHVSYIFIYIDGIPHTKRRGPYGAVGLIWCLSIYCVREKERK